MKRCVAIAAVLAASWSVVVLAADPLANLHYYGANTLRFSHYEASGDNALGPYPFQGPMLFDEFNLYADHENSDYDRWRAEVSGVANVDDNYRALDNGLVPERLNFTRENGDVGLPYRLEAGDYFAYYSYLTLQRSLKGVQLELQPQSVNPDRYYSVVLSAGAQEPNWRDLNPEDNFSTGASLLMSDRVFGSFNLNLVHNYRDNAHRLNTLDRSQLVVSLAGEKDFQLYRQSLLLEGEFAHFSGDHDGRTGARSGQDRSENGYFVQLSGRSTAHPLDYRFRVEQYGQDFRPNGAIVSVDRRSMEAHTGWRFDSGLRLRGRAQVFEDGYETTNTRRTRTFGANLSGPILGHWVSGLTLRADSFVQISDDDQGLFGQHSKNLDVSLTAPLGAGWTGRASTFLQNLDDKVSPAGDRHTRQLALSADHGFELAGFSGLLTPGVLVRTLRRGISHSTDIFPTLAVSAFRGPHSLRFNYGSQYQNRKFTVSGADIHTQTVNADYRYTRGQHQFGVEGNFFNRDPAPGENTDAWRMSLFWTMSFDHVPADSHVDTALTPLAEDAGIDGLPLYALPAGSERNAVLAEVDAAGVGGGSDVAGFTVYEYPLLGEVFQRQRLALRFAGDTLTDSVLIIDFDDIGNRDSVAQTFERVREVLIRRFGAPARTFEEGDISATLAADVNGQRVIRVVEWRTAGGVLRFGIPRRLDGQVRMEIRHARTLPPPRDTLWSVEELR